MKTLFTILIILSYFYWSSPLFAQESETSEQAGTPLIGPRRCPDCLGRYLGIDRTWYSQLSAADQERVYTDLYPLAILLRDISENSNSLTLSQISPFLANLEANLEEARLLGAVRARADAVRGEQAELVNQIYRFMLESPAAPIRLNAIGLPALDFIYLIKIRRDRASALEEMTPVMQDNMLNGIVYMILYGAWLTQRLPAILGTQSAPER